MAIQTQIITGRLSEPDGDPITTGSVRFTLSKYDAAANGVIAASRKIEAPLESDGSIALELWPNTAGLRGTTYLVELVSKKGYVVETYGRIQIGEAGPYSLADLLREELPPATTSYWSTLTQAQYDAAIEAVELSQAWAEGTEPGGPGTKSAKDHAADASTSETNAATSAAQAALYDGVWLDDVATVIADTSLSYGPGASGVAEGDYVRTRAEGFSYQVAASGATDHHLTTAGGVKLYVLPLWAGATGGIYPALAFGPVGDLVADDRVVLQKAFDVVKATAGTLDLRGAAAGYRITSRVGTDTADRSDYAHGVTAIGPAVIHLDAPATSTAALVIEGDNVTARDLTFTNARTLNHGADLTPQRTPYHTGLVIGGKGYTDAPRSAGTLADFRDWAVVENVTITNYNLPLIAFRASGVRVRDCVITDFTDTGLLVDDCTTDIKISHNRIERGGDDLIFCRHYENSPWIAAAKYAGRIDIHDNHLAYTFGKCVGTGGYSDVQIHDNYTHMSWAGNINIEADDWANDTTLYNRNITIRDNIVSHGGRYWDSLGTYNKTAAIGNNNDAGIHTNYNNTRGVSTALPSNVKITGNLVVNPYGDGIAVGALDRVDVEGNTVIAGEYNHGAGNVKSTGVALWAARCLSYKCTGNKVKAQFTLAGGDKVFPTTFFLVSDGYKGAVIKNNDVDGVTTFSADSIIEGFEMDQVFKLRTSDATQTNVIAFTIPDSRTMSVRCDAVGASTSNSAHYDVATLYRRVTGGNLTQVGNNTVVQAESDAAWGFENGFDGVSNVLPRVTGAAATNIDWSVRVKATVLLP